MICFEKTGIPVFSRFSINFATFVRNISAMQTLFFWIDSVNNVLWSYLLVALLLGCAVWFTVRTRGVQFRMLREMLRVLGESAGGGRRGERHVSSFQAFAVSLASRVGTGNLAGVATAIAVGGPGAVFWMWIIAQQGLRAPSSNRPSPSSTNAAAGIPISVVRPIIWNGDWAGAGWAWSSPY